MKRGALLLLFFITEVFSADYPYYLRSPRGLLMGDAFTAVNDDEFTLMYNPASLARHKNDLTLYPFNPMVTGTNILSDVDKFEDFPKGPVEASEIIMDLPVHANAGIAPGFKFFNVGVTFLASESYDVLLRNKAHPMLDVDIRSDRGVLLGVGIPISSGRLSRKDKKGHQTSLGLTGKYIERSGVKDTLALSGPVVLEALGRDEFKEIVLSLGKVKGVGWGYDAGVEHISRVGNSQIVASLVALDIGGTEFKVPNNPDNLRVSDTPSQVNAGLAAGQDFGLFNYILSADFRGLNQQSDSLKKVRLGAQIGIPGIQVMAGMNSGYFSYGATLDIGFAKFTAGLFDIEIGTKADQIKSKRFILYLSLFDFSFDA
jgi:hypothetical protein